MHALSHTNPEETSMSDPIKAASESGWIAEHRAKYLADPKAGHLWDSTFAGGPGPLPTLLLTTRGAKSGQESVMPLLYGKVDGGYAIIASKGGAPKHPGWYHNLMKQGTVKVQVAEDVCVHLEADGRDVPALRRLPGQDRARDPGRRAGTCLKRQRLRRPRRRAACWPACCGCS
jgi:deazaflavin-dependent oxidoreductase (nitroreductase family)